MRSVTRVVGVMVLCCYADTTSIAETEKTLTVQEAVATALTHHPIVRIGATAVEAAQARVRQQIAGYLPRGAYTYAVTHQQQPLTSAVGGVQVGGGQQRTFSQIFNFHSTNFSMRRHAILVVTHEPDSAAFVQRRIVFRDGRIVADERQAGSVS